MRRTKRYIEVTIVVQRDDGAWGAECLELGTVSCGDTFEEACDNIIDAIECHLDTLELVGERKRFFRERGITLKRSPVVQRRAAVAAGPDGWACLRRVPVPA